MADENANIDGQYTEQIEKLKKVMEIAKANTKQNKTFRQTLTQKIQEITDLIQTLESLINNFINSRNANVGRIQDNNVEMNELQKKIDDCETKLAAVTAENNALSSKAPEEVKNTSELEGQIAGLEKEKQTLSSENEQIKKILKKQDDVILEVTNYLSDFSSDEPLDINELNKIITRLQQMITNLQSPPGVDVVKEADDQPESAISAITNKNNSKADQYEQPPQYEQPLQDEDGIELTQINPKEIYAKGMSYSKIKDGLLRKVKQEQKNTGRADNKYKLALGDLIKSEKNNQISEQNIINILDKNAIEIKNEKIMGGRKTRKKSRITKKRHKTQKGGYFYNKHRTSKRRKISSNLYKSSRRRNSKSKSNNSS